MNRLNAGVARAIINPPIGVDLCGYAGRVPGCTSIHDDIYAKALVLDDGQRRAAIVTLDLIGLDDKQVAKIRESAGAAAGIPAANILIGASHTHAGPATAEIRACGQPNVDYVAGLLVTIADTVKDAAKNVRPVKFGFGKAEAHIAINRRYRAPSGEIQIGDNKGGLTDNEVGIWRFTDDDGNEMATVFNYACHAVTMGGDNRLVSGDWPGAAQRAVERAVGGQAMFLQGCCGNINPLRRATFDEVENNGREVGDAVIGVLSGIPTTGDAEISVVCEVANLPLQAAISRKEAEQTMVEMAELLKNKDQLPLHEVHLNQAYYDWAVKIIELGDKAPVSKSFEVQCMSVNGAGIVALPGEVFVEYALNIKKMRSNIMVAAYANGNVGYVPTRKAFDQGGYEVDLAYKLYGEQKLSPMCESVILAAAERVLCGEPLP